MSFNGVHVAFGFIEKHSGLFWSPLWSETNEQDFGAVTQKTATKPYFGEPAFEVTTSANIYVSVGKNPTEICRITYLGDGSDANGLMPDGSHGSGVPAFTDRWVPRRSPRVRVPARTSVVIPCYEGDRLAWADAGDEWVEPLPEGITPEGFTITYFAPEG